MAPPPLDDRPAAGAERRRRGLEAQIRAPKWAYTRGNLKSDPLKLGQTAASADDGGGLGPRSEPQSGHCMIFKVWGLA